MYKVAVLIWIMLGTVLAGAGLTVVVATPSLEPRSIELIPIVVAIGFLLAIPASILVAKRIAA